MSNIPTVQMFQIGEPGQTSRGLEVKTSGLGTKDAPTFGSNSSASHKTSQHSNQLFHRKSKTRQTVVYIGSGKGKSM